MIEQRSFGFMPFIRIYIWTSGIWRDVNLIYSIFWYATKWAQKVLIQVPMPVYTCVLTDILHAKRIRAKWKCKRKKKINKCPTFQIVRLELMKEEACSFPTLPATSPLLQLLLCKWGTLPITVQKWEAYWLKVSYMNMDSHRNQCHQYSKPS